MRQPLKKGQTIQFGNGKKCIIEKVCGMGAMSIVYAAQNEDGERIRIKECYPVSQPITRNEKGELVAEDGADEQFDSIKRKFVASFDLQKKLRDREEKLTNSIIPLEGLYEYNGTYYITSIVMEGKDLAQNSAESLTAIIKILKSVAKVVKIYHEIGYLHLDIKPANIFRIPETDEHVLMFDFDSLIEKESIKQDKHVIISFSRNWAAPELLSSKWNKIGEATDVYAIGAIFFYSLFGREVSANDRMVRSRWDYSEAVNGMLDNVDPVIYAKITKFLHKTIECNVNRRYSDMNQVIAALEELKKLSDQEKRYIIPRPKRCTANFVGRISLLNDLDELLRTNQAVALTGMGGIGKTEIAYKYANNNEDYYGKIVCADYQGSIIKTICSNEIQVNKFGRVEGETIESFYKKKISFLHELFSKDDLLIIDNYDDRDENLGDILDLPCKIILTSRNDLADGGVACICVEQLDESEAITLFKIFNNNYYDDDNEKAIINLLKKVGYHTLTIELISKYLRDSGDLPTELFQKLEKKRNIDAFDVIDVQTQKDGRLQKATIGEHIKVLYSISAISESQKEVMLGLSLLENIKISRRLFMTFFDWKGSLNDLNELINKGWIKSVRHEDKVYLHPLIQQIVVSLKPDTKNCKRFLEVLICEYDKEKTYYEYKNWRDLFEIVFKNISGEDYLYAVLCKREGSMQSWEKAVQIFGKNSKEHFDFSLLCFRTNLEKMLDDDMDIFEWNAGENADLLVEKRVNMIVDRYNAEISKQWLLDPNGFLISSQIDYIIDVSKALCEELDESMCYLMSIKPREELCKKIANSIEDVVDYVCSLEINGKLDENAAIVALTQLESFLNPDNSLDCFGFCIDYLCNEDNKQNEQRLKVIKKELRKYREKNHQIGLMFSVNDENTNLTTYCYSDGDQLTINTITGEMVWVDTWYDDLEHDWNPFTKTEGMTVINTKREEVCTLMRQMGADDTWYDYCCAVIDSDSKSGDEADLIWLKAFRAYNYDLRFICSNAREMAMKCLEKVSNDYYMRDWNYVNDFCSLAVELNLREECRNCYTSALNYLLKEPRIENKDLFDKLCYISSSANDAGYVSDAIRCLAYAVIILVGRVDYTIVIDDYWLIEDDTIGEMLKQSLRNSTDTQIINDINWMFEKNVLILKENMEVYDQIKSFLIREKYRDIDFI